MLSQRYRQVRHLLPKSKFDANHHKTNSKLCSIYNVFVVIFTCFIIINALALSSFESLSGLFFRNSYQTAYQQSGGFFTDVNEKDWNLLRNRVERRVNHCRQPENQCYENPNVQTHNPRAWYQDNWEPDFTCTHERRIGGMGDGAKWVCDPHRIAEKKDGCLVYSVGSEGKFEFELSVLNEIHEQCEVHTFDPNPSYAGNAPENIHYHSWGFASEKNTYNGKSNYNYKSLKQTIDELGHRDRVIDIFKIDCEGCEWTTFREWFFPNVYESTILKQILVEVHNVPNEADSFFRYLQKQGYVTFHKEPNIKFAGGDCVEYALLNLDKSFFEGMTFKIDKSYPPVPAPVEAIDNLEELKTKIYEKVLEHVNSNNQ